MFSLPQKYIFPRWSIEVEEDETEQQQQKVKK